MSNEDLWPDDAEKRRILLKLGWYYEKSPNGTGDMNWGYIGKDMPAWCPDGATSCECLEVVWKWYCEREAPNE